MQEHTYTQPEGSFVVLAAPFLFIAVLAVAYLLGVARQRTAANGWSRWRTSSFLAGLGLIALAMAPYLVQFAHKDIRGHMVQHLLIGMLAPLALVLGAPVTLALRSLPAKASHILAAVLGSRAFHLLSHPITALLLNIGGMYVLYLTPLYNATLTNPFLHHFVHIHFLAAGYLFSWSIAGPDPAPGRPVLKLRVLVLFLSIASHAYLSKIMYARLYPHNSPHSYEQIRAAAKLMYYGGDFAELLLTIALFALWYQKRGRPYYNLRPLIR